MMNFELWKVKMERWLTDGKSPDVKIKSVITYDIPKEYSEMLSSLPMIEEEHHDSVIENVYMHVREKFENTGFYPQEMISP